MIIRTASEKDIKRIGELLVQVCNVHNAGRPDIFVKNGRKYEDSDLVKMLSDSDHKILVAADENDFVCGYVFCEILQNKGNKALTDIKTLYIDDLCVDESLRGRHIGKSLFDAAVDFARTNGFYNITLNVWSCNGSAMRFYEKCGLNVQKSTMEAIL